MKYFLRSFSPFRCFKKGSCQFLAKECAQYWPRRGGSNEYPQSMFLSRNNKTNNVYPRKPQFYYIKVGFKGGQNYIGMFS